MDSRSITASILLAQAAALGPWTTLTAGVDGKAQANAGFDLQSRKQKQPWLWQSSLPQPLPPVQNIEWARTPEDRFILQRLEQAGLAPAPPAEARTWLRRVHFAITGLPPTREEIQNFLADTTRSASSGQARATGSGQAAGARERVVDSLLASPHFGERWARHWMDLVRYAESRGHEEDFRIANAWHYRDYLIRAFNEDVPYRQLLAEHLAGDLLPYPRLRPGTDINESVLGTGWVFLGEENHSPVDIRQDECERIDNKVDVFSKTFLGLTVSCARCHDHKFDPIRAQDYYALSGFFLGSSFRQVRFEAMENNRAMAIRLKALREQYAGALAAAVATENARGCGEIAAYLLVASEIVAAGQPDSKDVVARVASERKLESVRLRPWVEQLRDGQTNRGNPLYEFAHLPLSGATNALQNATALEPHQSGSTPVLPADARVIADFTTPGRQPWKVDGEAFGAGTIQAGELVLGDSLEQSLMQVMPYGAARRDLFWKGLKAAPDNELDSGRLGATGRSGQTLLTPTVTLGIGRVHYLIRGQTLVYAAVDSHLMNEGPLHARMAQAFNGGLGLPRWVTHDLTAYSGHRMHVEFGPDGSNELEVLLVVESAEPPKWVPAPGPLGPDMAPRSATEYATAFQRAATEANDLLRHSALARSSAPLPGAMLANWLVQNPQLLRNTLTPPPRPARDYVAALHDLAGQVRWESHTAVAWHDGTGVDENVLERGKPFKPGAISPRSLPVAFASARPITTRTSSGRAELVDQLIDPGNPLVARVVANRVWHHLFGRGIVATVDNFGALGEAPTHPELLDHLAYQFTHEDAWSLKRLIRRLVLTQTFAMSSRADNTHAEEIDPANALLHRMPVRRLEAEAIRDSLLLVSGRFNPAVGGPPVTVYLTEFLVGRGRPEKSGPLDGDGRRSIYTGIRRNFLPTLMQTFDAPTPFSTVGKRNVTNVPGQALALMNDELFHQQARVWAERMAQALPKAGPRERLAWLFESAYGRMPISAETAACLESLDELRTLYPATGANDASDVEAWADLCHALLNANDFIYVK